MVALIFIAPLKYNIMPDLLSWGEQFQRVPFGNPQYNPYSTDQGPNVAVTPTAT